MVAMRLRVATDAEADTILWRFDRRRLAYTTAYIDK